MNGVVKSQCFWTKSRLTLAFAALLLNFAGPARVQADSWKFAGYMSTNRQLLTATLLPNGKVLVTGGYPNNLSRPTNTTALYDPTSGKWTAAAAMADRRAYHSATLLPDGKVLVAAGGSDGTNVLTSAEIYNPTNN